MVRGAEALACASALRTARRRARAGWSRFEFVVMAIPPKVAQRVFNFKSAKLRIFMMRAARAVRIRILVPRTTPLLRRRATLFPCHALDDVCLYGFKCRSVVRESLRAEVSFEFQEQLRAFGFARAFEGHTLVVVRGRGGRGAKFRTAHTLQPREDFPGQLIVQTPQPF